MGVLEDKKKLALAKSKRKEEEKRLKRGIQTLQKDQEAVNESKLKAMEAKHENALKVRVERSYLRQQQRTQEQLTEERNRQAKLMRELEKEEKKQTLLAEKLELDLKKSAKGKKSCTSRLTEAHRNLQIILQDIKEVNENAYKMRNIFELSADRSRRSRPSVSSRSAVSKKSEVSLSKSRRSKKSERKISISFQGSEVKQKHSSLKKKSSQSRSVKRNVSFKILPEARRSTASTKSLISNRPAVKRVVFRNDANQRIVVSPKPNKATRTQQSKDNTRGNLNRLSSSRSHAKKNKQSHHFEQIQSIVIANEETRKDGLIEIPGMAEVKERGRYIQLNDDRPKQSFQFETFNPEREYVRKQVRSPSPQKSPEKKAQAHVGTQSIDRSRQRTQSNDRVEKFTQATIPNNQVPEFVVSDKIESGKIIKKETVSDGRREFFIEDKPIETHKNNTERVSKASTPKNSQQLKPVNQKKSSKEGLKPQKGLKSTNKEEGPKKVQEVKRFNIKTDLKPLKESKVQIAKPSLKETIKKADKPLLREESKVEQANMRAQSNDIQRSREQCLVSSPAKAVVEERITRVVSPQKVVIFQERIVVSPEKKRTVEMGTSPMKEEDLVRTWEVQESEKNKRDKNQSVEKKRAESRDNGSVEKCKTEEKSTAKKKESIKQEESTEKKQKKKREEAKEGKELELRKLKEKSAAFAKRIDDRVNRVMGLTSGQVSIGSDKKSKGRHPCHANTHQTLPSSSGQPQENEQLARQVILLPSNNASPNRIVSHPKARTSPGKKGDRSGSPSEHLRSSEVIKGINFEVSPVRKDEGYQSHEQFLYDSMDSTFSKAGQPRLQSPNILNSMETNKSLRKEDTPGGSPNQHNSETFPVQQPQVSFAKKKKNQRKLKSTN